MIKTSIPDVVPVMRTLLYQPPQIKAPGAWRGRVPHTTEWRSKETNRLVADLFAGEDDAPAA